jgi:hypothetical protein
MMGNGRPTAVFAGLLIALLGIWAALIPFVGPYFDYAFGVNTTWHYTGDRLWLCVLPGAAAFVGGALLVMRSRFGGVLAMVTGIWFIVGPTLSLIWNHHTNPIGAPLFDSTRQALELIGYFYGVGALILLLAAFATGRVTISQPAAEPVAAPAKEPLERPRLGLRQPQEPHAA